MQLTASTHCAPLAIARPTGRKLTLKLRATGDNSVATPPTPVSKAKTFGQLMAFSGTAPEAINSRLAQLGFVSALGAELATGAPVTQQLSQDGALVLCTVVAISCASLIPLLLGKEIEGWGPFTPRAEMLNGRAAMIGFAALLVIEAIRGQALF